MSLINQMLRDLQGKKGGAQTKPTSKRSIKMERIPFLPLPLVLGGAALLLVCFIWWMAGALSDWMFGFEPVASQEGASQVAVVEEQPTTENPLQRIVEQEQLSTSEREAEAPVEEVVAVSQAATLTSPEVSKEQPVPAKLVTKEVAVAPVVSKPKTVRAKPTQTAITKRKQTVVPKRVTQKTKKTQPPKEVVAAPAKRMHPDDLPGAVKSRPRTLPEPVLAPRPSRVPANTPYGMAEEAYLDGKWASERERGNLAIRSLQHALDLYPGHLPARELLVKILSQKGKNGEAMYLLAEGLEIAPDYMAFKKRYARLLMDQSDYDAATKVMLNGGLPSVEDDPEAHVVLASLYQRLEEPFLAAQTYRNLLVAWPQTGAFWVGLGGALESQHLSGDAVECYQKALKTKNLRQDLMAYARKRLSLLN